MDAAEAVAPTPYPLPRRVILGAGARHRWRRSRSTLVFCSFCSWPGDERAMKKGHDMLEAWCEPSQLAHLMCMWAQRWSLQVDACCTWWAVRCWPEHWSQEGDRAR